MKLRAGLLLAAVLCFAGTFTTSAQLRSDTLTIKQLQYVPDDSLNAGKQNSLYVGDTVTVTGIVIAAPRISPGGPLLFALGNANTMYIVDENGGAWSGLNVRASDSVASASTLLTAVDTGFVVRITGVVTQYFSTTQFELGKVASWNADRQVEVLDTKPRRPEPTEIKITDLVNGDPKAFIPASQQWEGAYVVIKDASVGTVTKNTSTGRYTWTVTDGKGNSIGVYDQSVYFRGGSQGFDPNWAPPPAGTQLTSIRGVITSSGQGIVIAPIYPGDIVLGSFPPTIRGLKRDIGIPTSSQEVTVTATVETARPGGSIATAELEYGQGATSLGKVTMTWDATSKLATGKIPAQADGAVIWYTLKATDDKNESALYPAAGAKARPFFIVRNGATRIRDIQYTPYSDGAPGCLDATVSVRGTVVSAADSTSLSLVYLMDDTAPWSGIMVRGDAAIRALALGEDVTVSGKVAEGYSSATNGNTAIIDATVVTKHGTAAVPAPVNLTTGAFRSGVVTDGTPDAEQWEGMLVRFATLTVTARNADAPAGSNFGEFLVTDGSGDMRVDDFGSWKKVYTTDSSKTTLTLLKEGTRLASLTGIMFFNFGNYKLEPRNAGDFDGVTGISYTPASPARATLHASYPNPVAAGSVATLRFETAETGSASLALFDALGRRVVTLFEGETRPGQYSVPFNTASLAPGVYHYQLLAGSALLRGSLIIR